MWDTSKPDGIARNLLDSTKFLATGWKQKVNFNDGLQTTYKWYADSVAGA